MLVMGAKHCPSSRTASLQTHHFISTDPAWERQGSTPTDAHMLCLTDTVLALYHPTSPLAALALRATATLVRHIFLVELPKSWDLALHPAQRRGGRGWKTGARDTGEEWEAVMTRIMSCVLVSFFS